MKIIHSEKGSAVNAHNNMLLLVRACEELLSYLTFQEPETAVTRPLFNLARKALALAKGEKLKN
jgi:hypothetical protein